jgi:outer membrane protein assembly factor BamB/TolB-like protein
MNLRYIFVCLLLAAIFTCKNDSKQSNEIKSNNNKCVVISLEGNAYLSDENKSKSLKLSIGDKIKENDYILTDIKSLVELQIGDSSIIKIKDNTLLEIRKLFVNENVQSTNLFLKNGKILAKPEKQDAGSSFTVETESITAGVRGTEFSVIVDDSGTIMKKISILPFLNENNDSKNGFLMNTISDTLYAGLNLPQNFSFTNIKSVEKIMSNADYKISSFQNGAKIGKIAKELKSDLILTGKFSAVNNKIKVVAYIYDSNGRQIFSESGESSSGIEIFDCIRNIGNTLSPKLKEIYPSKNITKIAVNEGTVNCAKKIDIDNIEKIKEINPELAVKMLNISNLEISLSPGEKIEVPQEQISKIENKISSISIRIINEAEVKKTTQKNITNLVNQIENTSIKEITASTEKIIKTHAIKEEEKNKVFNVNEFEDLRKKQEDIKAKQAKSENNQVVKKEEKKYSVIRDTINKNDDTKYNDTNTLSKTDTEKSKNPEYIFKKKITGFDLKLSEVNTAVLSYDKLLYITDDKNKSIFCVDPETSKILWTYKDPSLKLLNTPAFPYKDFIIFSTYNNILILNNNGKVKTSLNISGGSGFWASPIVYKDTLYIPVSKGFYTYDGNSLKPVGNLPVFYGQLYPSNNNDSFFIVDSIYAGIFQFDFELNSIKWKSDKIQHNIYTTPAFSKNYMIISDAYDSMYRFDYLKGKTTPDILNINTGVLSNIISRDNSVFFIGKDGYFYKINVDIFSNSERIFKVDNNPDQNKYLTKKMLSTGDDLYFSSDTGRLFHYNIKSSLAEFINSDPAGNSPLIGTPAMINNMIYVMDTDANIYELQFMYTPTP